MKRSDLEILLQEGEGSTLEYKESLSSSFARDLVAFAKGADKVHVLDRKDFDGGVVADIEDAMRFIERNTRTAWRIETLRRENIPEYPTKALREAVTNAVMHRDWFMEGANVFVELYTDRIEVVSPGGLPKGMLPADLGHKSVRRNALIADLLHRIEFIEKAGTGIKRIRDEARAQGCPEPVWEANGFVTVIFRPNPAVRAQAEAQGAGGTATAPEVTPQVPRKYPPSSGDPQRGFNRRTNSGRAAIRRWREGQGALPQTVPQAPADLRSAGSDHPRQAAQQQAALPNHPPRPGATHNARQGEIGGKDRDHQDRAGLAR
jgi:hypothetical protein